MGLFRKTDTAKEIRIAQERERARMRLANTPHTCKDTPDFTHCQGCLLNLRLISFV